LGNNLVCAQAGDAIRRIANTSFFISFSQDMRRSAFIEPDRLKEVHKVIGIERDAAQPIRLLNI
jgi:hypothetical protein